MQNLINKAGFGCVIIVEHIDINQHLMSALVEHWRPETHISFSTWKTTITLEDVVLMLSPKIDGLPVTSVVNGDVCVACEALLGDILPDKYIKGKMIYLT